MQRIPFPIHIKPFSLTVAYLAGVIGGHLYNQHNWTAWTLSTLAVVVGMLFLAYYMYEAEYRKRIRPQTNPQVLDK